MRPKSGWFLPILPVYSGFMPFCCQSLVFIQSLRCLLRVNSCFFKVLHLVDIIFKFLFFLIYLCSRRTWTNVCPCRLTFGYLMVTWRSCSWAVRPSTSRWADAPAEHHWWDGERLWWWRRKIRNSLSVFCPLCQQVLKCCLLAPRVLSSFTV